MYTAVALSVYNTTVTVPLPGYGTEGRPKSGIPGDSNLHFDILLEKLVKPSEEL